MKIYIRTREHIYIHIHTPETGRSVANTQAYTHTFTYTYMYRYTHLYTYKNVPSLGRPVAKVNASYLCGHENATTAVHLTIAVETELGDRIIATGSIPAMGILWVGGWVLDGWVAGWVGGWAVGWCGCM